MFDQSLEQFLKTLDFIALLRALLVVSIGYFIAKLTAQSLKQICLRLGWLNYATIISKIFFYFVYSLFLLSALSEFGFNLNLLIGAAGIFTVAVGLASQTSVSNLISGLFLVGEQPFRVGDTIIVNQTTGEVLAVDLFATKLRIPDNTLIRYPNEMLLKTPLINLSRFPTRRFESHLNVPFTEKIDHIEKILLDLAANHPLCLKSPAPSVSINTLGEYGATLQFFVWAAQKDYDELKNSMQREIFQAFSKHNIQMAIPARKVYFEQQAAPNEKTT